MAAIMTALKAARQLLTDKLTKQDTFSKRTQELRDRLSALELERRASVDVTDMKRIEAEMGEIEAEINIISEVSAKTSVDVSAHAEAIDKLRAETTGILEKKLAEDERKRAEIASAREAFMKLLREQYAIHAAAGDVVTDVNEVITSLSLEIAREVRKLREQARIIDRQISELSVSGGTNPRQSEIDRMYAEYDEVRRKATELERQSEAMRNPVKQLIEYKSAHQLKIYASPYFLHELDQTRASRGQ